jgi:hypothetical protein
MPPVPEPDLPAETAAEQQLADLLEACLRAESALPGSAAAIVASAPEALRGDLEQLIALGQLLRSGHHVELAPAVRQGLRMRIITRITAPAWPRFISVSSAPAWPRFISVSSVRRRLSRLLQNLLGRTC